MYKSREDEYQRRFDTNDGQNSYGYDNTRPSYQDDIYDEDDFYGQIMKNASKNNPYRNIQPEPHQDYGTGYEPSFQEPRRSRMEATSRLPRMEEEPYNRPTYQERDERPVNPYQKPVSSYSENTYAQPEYTAQIEFKQPVRAYERTSQFSNNQPQGPLNDYSSTSGYNTAPLRETPSRRARVQEEPYVAREPQINPYAQEEPIAPIGQRRRARPVEEPQPTSYGGFSEDLIEEPKRASKAPMTLSEEYESQRKKKKGNKPKAAPKLSQKKEVAAITQTVGFKSFVKQNLIIFVYALVNCIALSFIVASLVYTQVIQNYVMPSGVQDELIKLSLIVAPILAYQVAGFHCGYFMLRNKLQNMKPAFKIILSPILFIVFEAVGIICEIPYLIYAMVKMGDE